MSETIYLGTDEIRASAGKFRTSRRYIRNGASITFYIAQGKTINVGFALGVPTYRYSVAGYVIDPRSTGGFDATVTGCTL